MIEYNGFVYAAPPRTGTAFMSHVLSCVGLGNPTRSKVHEPFPSGYKGYKVSTIRHPYSWLVSYYFEIGGMPTNIEVVDKLIPPYQSSSGVSGFIQAVCNDLPENSVADVFLAYEADTCLRLEDMPWALYEFLDGMNIVWPMNFESAAKSPMNINKLSRAYEVDQRLRRLVVDCNREFCDRFEYYG